MYSYTTNIDLELIMFAKGVRMDRMEKSEQ